MYKVRTTDKIKKEMQNKMSSLQVSEDKLNFQYLQGQLIERLLPLVEEIEQSYMVNEMMLDIEDHQTLERVSALKSQIQDRPKDGKQFEICQICGDLLYNY